MSVVRRYIPIAAWLPSYNAAWLRPDIVAGLSTSAVVIPKAMAYAAIAGLPVQVGLYSSLIPMFAYAVLGTARTLSVSTSSTIGILVAAVIANLSPNGDAAAKIAIASTLALLVGIFLIVGSVLRLGVVADFISEPVLVGFKAGIGIVIIVDQLPKLLGVHITKAGLLRDVGSIITHLPHAEISTLIVGVVSLLLIFALEHFWPNLPAPLFAVALGIPATVLLGLANHGVPLLGKIPSGFPPFAAPNLSLVSSLWPGALGIALMSFTESIAAARAFSPTTEPPNANPDMFAIGIGNIGVSFFSGMPSGGGTSQTAMNTNAGAQSQLAEIVTFLVVLASLLFLSPLLALIPAPTLAAVIVAANLPMISPGDFLAIYQIRKLEFSWAVAAFLGVMFLGTLKGILVAVLLSILTLVHSASYPPLYQLARKPGTNVFRPLTPDHPQDETYPGLLILRTEGTMTFASVPHLRDKLREMIKAAKPNVILIDFRVVPLIEYTALKVLTDAVLAQRSEGIDTWLAGLTPGVLALIRRAPLGTILGPERLFYNVPLAVEAYESRLRAT